MFPLKLMVFLVGCIYVIDAADKKILSCDCGWTKKPEKNDDDDESEIVMGENAIAGEFPYIVYIKVKQNDKYFIGAGSILNRRYVVTVAHYLYAEFVANPEDITLIYNITNINSKNLKTIPHKNTMEVDEIIVHPEFDPKHYFSNDIAILKISGFFPIKDKSNVGPACLPMQDERIADQNPTVAGWGDISYSDPINNIDSYVLHKVNLTIQTNLTECNKKWKELFGKHDIFETGKPTQICTNETKSNKSICWGDFGAPMVSYDSTVQRYVLRGLGQIFNDPVLHKKNPKGCQGLNAFVDVTKYIKWIEQVVKATGHHVCKKIAKP